MLNQDELQAKVTEVLGIAQHQPGVTAAAVGGNVNTGLSVTVRLGDIETVEFNRDKSIDISVYKGQSTGTVTVNDLNTEAVINAVQAACRIADYTQPDEYAGLADADKMAKQVPDLDLYFPEAVDAEQAKQWALEAENAAREVSPKIVNSDGANFSRHENYYVYGNTHGFIGSYPITRYSSYCGVIGEQDGVMQSDYDYTVGRKLNQLQSFKAMGQSAGERTLSRLGSRKIKTGQYPVIFSADMAVGFWGNLIAAISGGNLYRKASFLVDHLGKPVCAPLVNIVERPLILGGLGSAPFDHEGVATTNKDIIKEGVLATYLLGSYAARKLGMTTTGNAGGVFNLKIQTQDLDQAALLQEMGSGLLVTELMGHGTNILTGDYSRGAAGFWVENGQIQYPVHEITIAGNLRDMFTDVVAIANDLELRGNVETGSVLLKSMMIAGN